MTKLALPLMMGLGLASSAFAGPTYSVQPVPPAPAPSCLWTWFAGGSAGYVSGDWDEEIYTLHVGIERKCAGNACGSHAFFLEGGYTENKIDYVQRTRYDVEVIPVTLNYKYECALTGNLNWYVGAGAGAAFVDSSVNFGNIDDDDTVFYAHIFAGVTYNVSESFELFAGVKYIFMDDVDAFDGAPFEDETNLDEDFHYELGARFNF